VPRDWFLPFEGARLLGLASAGGQQMPVFAALGARVTGFDLSDNHLASERLVDCSEEELRVMAARGAIEFSHSLETQIGGQLEAGLRLIHLYEDHYPRGALGDRAPAFVATRAVKP